MRFPTTLPLLLALILTLSISGIASAGDRDKDRKHPAGERVGAIQVVPHMVVVKLRPAVAFTASGSALGVASIDRVLARIGATAVTAFKAVPAGSYMSKLADPAGVTRIVRVAYAADDVPAALARELAANPDVEYAEPYYVYPVNNTPNDPMLSQQWALTMMHLAEAWDVTTGSESVVIGDIDTGCDWTHPDLTASVWINPGEWGVNGELSNNGIDDDHNGKIDDYHGWDFIGVGTPQNPLPDNNPMDGTLGHGTNTAGCAAATTNNAVGIAGTGYRCKVLPIKAASDVTGGISGYEGILYAADMGCKVINCSWGGTGAFSQAMQDVINYAYAHGALVVASAGNDAIDNDGVAHYPSSFNHVLCVGSVETSGSASNWATYGGTVHVYAPGSTILTTKNGGGYTSPTGTSFSSPLTAGVAALVFSQHPTWTPDQVMKQIRVTTDGFTGTRNPKYYGRVNAFNAVSKNQTLADYPGINVRSKSIVTPTGAYFSEGGQTANITLELENLLAPTSPAAVLTISSLDTSLKLDKSSVPIGAIATMGTTTLDLAATLSNTPLLSEGDIVVQLKLTDGAFVDYLFVRVPVNIEKGWHTALIAQIPLFSSVSTPDGFSAWLTADISQQGTPSLDYCLRTTDAGYTWYNAAGTSFPTGQGVYCVAGINSVTALVGTGPSSGAAAISRTTNGGQSWTGTSVSAYTGFVNWIHMFDQLNGIFQGDPKNGRWGIATTTDGGRTWTPLATPVTSTGSEAGWNNSVDFVGQTGWFGTNSSRIYKTTDGGVTWRSLATPNIHSVDISFRDENTGVIRFSANNGTGTDALAVTTDGGSSWKTLTTITVTGGKTMMERGGRRFWFIDNGNAYVSTNLGATWSIQARPNGFDPIIAGDIHCSSTTTAIFVAGQDIFRFISPFDPLVGIEAATPALPAMPTLDGVYPQPASTGAMRIEFTVPRGAQATLAVYDMTGRLVRTVMSATLEGGRQSAGFSTAGLASGAYLLRLDVAGMRASRPFIVR